MRLPYGKTEIAVNLTGFLKVKTFAPPEPDRLEAPRRMAAESLKSPVESPSLTSLARNAARAVVVIPDRTRPRVARQILPAVMDSLLEGGVEFGRITVFVANGSHRLHSDDELQDLVGQAGGGLPIYQNRSIEIGDYEKLGATRRGTPVLVNRKVLEADLRVVIGPVAYHYFAGWGGGRKMIVPGAAHFETICSNHRLTIDEKGNFNPACRNGSLEGNPVHEDLEEAVSLVPNVFAVNVLLDGWARTVGVVSGRLVESYATAVARARRLLDVETGAQCDLAIASAGGHPLDLDLLQTHKTIDHAAGIVRDGGVVVVFAECPNGLGSDDLMSWVRMGSTAAISKRLLWQYRIHGHTALSLMKKLERIRVILVSSLPRRTVEDLGLIPAQDADEALALACGRVGDQGLTYVFPCAWGILPII
jgi:nickel-dependent lactate racemase